MSKQTTLTMAPDVAEEMPMVDIVFEMLSQSGEPKYYRDMVKEISKLKGLSNDEMLSRMAQLYTEINIDGRFICVGRSLWGLKEWYTLDQGSDASVAASVKDDETLEDEEDDDDEEIEEKEAYDEEEDDPDEDDDFSEEADEN